MTARRLAVALACLGVAAPSAGEGPARQMTFDEALTAVRESPRLARVAADVEAAEAALVTAGTYPHDPEVEIEVADRRGAGGSTTDRGIGLSQRLEMAGQRGERRDAAEAALTAARATFRQAQVEILGDVVRAFADAVHRREILAIEEVEAELAGAFADLMERRVEAGSATAIDLALARAGLARAERGLALARGSDRTARARLAESVGAADSPFVTPTGGLPPLKPPPPLEELLARALAAHGDLAAAAARVEAAEARARLARAMRVPDLTVGARAGREEGDDVTGVSLGIPIPLFDRNRGGIAEAEAEVSTARSELALAELSVRREVAAAHGNLETALAALQAAQRLGVTPLEEGLSLLHRSFEAGKIGSAELLLYRRELVEGRRHAAAASREAWEAALDLAVATGGLFPDMDWMDEETDR